MSNSSKKNSSRIFLGIDPGTTIIGYGVIQETSKSLRCLDYGIIQNDGKNHQADLSATYGALRSLVSRYKPDEVSVERLFFTKNQKTVMAVGEMRGAILLSLSHAGVPIREFTPLQMKRIVCNYGMADKRQVQKAVQLLLHLESPIKPDDAADALGLAICAAVSKNESSGF